MGEVLKGYFPYSDFCYEDKLRRRISNALSRADSFQEEGDWQSAERELTRADALKDALRDYQSWGL